MSAQPKSLRSGELTAASLPADGSWLVGRAGVVGSVLEALAPGNVVTVTGTGGVGKTSVALEAARTVLCRSEPVIDGVWFCAMAAVDSAPTIPVAIADSIGLAPTDEASSYDSVVTGLSGLRGVLIVDHCEHIASPIAGVLQRLVGDCPDLAVLVTSREPLRLGRERVVQVHPLAVDEAAQALFVRRAEEADPQFQRFGHDEVIRRICVSLDGLPLALELAAAHLGTMPIDAVGRAPPRTVPGAAPAGRCWPQRRAACDGQLVVRVARADRASPLRSVVGLPGRVRRSDSSGNARSTRSRTCRRPRPARQSGRQVDDQRDRCR